jgi:hypothetical protein
MVVDAKDQALTVMRKHEPRRYAEECIKQAAEALTESDRLLFLDMAQGWLGIAEREESIAALELIPQETAEAVH